MTSATPKATIPIRVYPSSHVELLEIQQEFYEETRGKISLADIIAGLLADRKAWRAMGDAALAADRKPVPS